MLLSDLRKPRTKAAFRNQADPRTFQNVAWRSLQPSPRFAAYSQRVAGPPVHADARARPPASIAAAAAVRVDDDVLAWRWKLSECPPPEKPKFTDRFTAAELEVPHKMPF